MSVMLRTDWRTPERFVLNFERREDGGLRVWSDDIPGLILSGSDHAAVVRDIVPAIDVLMRHNADLRT